ncbi:MAG TPA: hypothetical protein VG125_19575 [Pirellulales bacterium]|jgi:hypothetical protein|nr:hypothetical protein [Pirellulales bacterium]
MKLVIEFTAKDIDEAAYALRRLADDIEQSFDTDHNLESLDGSIIGTCVDQQERR